MESVSYTHLDVYKRQAHNDPAGFYGERIHLTVYESQDEAVTWKPLFEVDVKGGYADIGACLLYTYRCV